VRRWNLQRIGKRPVDVVRHLSGRPERELAFAVDRGDRGVLLDRQMRVALVEKEVLDHVFEDLFFYQGNTHLPIEQHASVAAVDGEGKLTLWSSTQVPHYIHRALANALQIPPAHVRVIACPNGGGFGGKCDLHNHEIVVSKAAILLGRPVKICLTREEVFYMHRGRHPVLMKMRTGVTKDGKITAMH